MSESLHQRQEGGKRTDWAAAKRPADKPLITIITSTFNVVRDLPWTSDSLWGQTYPYIQWIVADGASTDGTVEWLSQHDELIDVWFSEPDSGIYDAWNKAVAYAKGDWIQFIGAGDELAASDTLDKVSSTLHGSYPNANLVHGRIQYVSEIERVDLDEGGGDLNLVDNGCHPFLPSTPPHTALFSHTTLFQSNRPFSTKYKIAADQLFMIKAIADKSPIFIDIFICRMPLGGVSGNLENLGVVSSEAKLISKELGIKLSLRQRISALKVDAKILLIRTLPRESIPKVADLYRKMLGKKARWTIS
jgi:glycosyltransferase involved in cell wall biosynthesis